MDVEKKSKQSIYEIVTVFSISAAVVCVPSSNFLDFLNQLNVFEYLFVSSEWMISFVWWCTEAGTVECHTTHLFMQYLWFKWNRINTFQRIWWGRESETIIVFGIIMKILFRFKRNIPLNCMNWKVQSRIL